MYLNSPVDSVVFVIQNFNSDDQQVEKIAREYFFEKLFAVN